MASAWDEFKPASGEVETNPWDEFKPAHSKRSKAKRDRGRTASPVAANDTTQPIQPLTGAAVDGDTLALQQDGRLRLYGVEAPELQQQGWDRLGNPVPIGQQATVALDEMVGPDGSIGTIHGRSYGRPVAPVVQDGRDVGEAMVRSGGALAAPKYLAEDPARAFEYQQAERLARLNGLGVHDTLHQRPEQFRADPGYVPDRETVAQFWDTPTPQSGLTPEDEQRYLAILNDPQSKPEDVVAFARERGGVVNPADVQAFKDWQAKYHGAKNAVEYVTPPKLLTDQGDGAVGSFARGIGDGFLPNMLDEAGAVVDTLGLTENRENVFNSDRRLADIWANNQKQNEAITGYDELAHPYARLTGEIAGGLPLPAGRVNSVADLAKFGGAYGFAAGFGGGDSLPDRLTSGVVNAGAGATIGVVGGKALDAAMPKLAAGWRWLRGKDGNAVPVPNEVVGTTEAPRAPGAPREADRLDIGPAPDRAGFGPVFDDVDPADWSAVVGRLAGAATGEVRGALDHPDIGPIDLPWGEAGTGKSDGFGLAKLLKFHPDIVPDLPGLIRSMPIVKRTANRVQLETADHKAAVRLDWDGEEKSWLLTALRKDDTPPATDDRRVAGGARDGSPSAGDGSDINLQGLGGNSTSRTRDYLDMGAVRPRRMDQPMTEAQLRAASERVEPGDVLPIASNEVGSAEEAAAIEAGRYAPAKPVDEATALARRTITAANGRPLPKRGPLDLVTWLRSQGGLKDQGGNLRAMGIGNEARDLDFARGEQRFGRLVDDERGMNLDDAALRAWEAGYLPGDERPDINRLLEAIDATHSGREQFFHPDDMPEVEQFDAMRADRLDLEKQLRDGPVVNDRSVPVDEPPPLPPIEAYEDWPDGGPDFAGNIRLEKLETPQDIRRALSVTEQRVGFDAATRGRVSQAETERLASELGMTPDKLLSRRKGQALNAEEALAARQILAKSGNELVNLARKVQAFDDPGDELLSQFRHAWMRHVAIQEQVSGMTAEAGRALQQFRMAASSRAVRGDVLNALVRGGGGTHNLKEAAEKLLEASEVSPGVFNALAQKATKSKWSRRISEVYINFLLSNPATHVVNMTSNTLTAMAQIPEHGAAMMFGKARQAFARKPVDRIIANEVGARMFGFIQGAQEGARLFARALKTGEPSDYVSKVEGEDYKAIPGLAGEVLRIPTRLLTAEDELFKGIARRMELNGLAARQAYREGLKGEAAARRIDDLVTDPPDALLERAAEYGRYLTFQSRLGPFAQHIGNAAQHSLIAKLFLPFIRTPTNLLKFAAERSPAAPAMKEWRKEFMAGGARRDIAMARMTVGTGFGVAIYQAALAGHITGAAPTDAKKARLLAAEGWQPYSFKLGDTYYSYKRLDPFAMTLGVAADLATLPAGMSERQRENEGALVVASILGNLASKTWLSGVSDLVEAISDPARNSEKMLERLVGSLTVPAGVAGVARALDPTARETESIGDAVKARIPGLRDDLLPRRNIWGEPVVFDSGFLSPAYTSSAKRDPVNMELLKLDYAPGFVANKVGGRELTAAEQDAYQEQSGKLAHERLTVLVAGQEWKSADLEARAKLAKKTVDAARREVRGSLFGGGDEPTNDDWSDLDSAPSSPPKATSEWDSFRPVAQPDVVGDLQRLIPGVQMTSGFRDAEYQADLKRRGYKPADNSPHLDGGSLDLLPPPGKSVGWLKAQVKRYRRDAEMLYHDGHLHVTFPGWFGAPVLGGAKAAGLSNPMEGL